MTQPLIMSYPGQAGPHRCLNDHPFSYLLVISDVLEHWAYRPIGLTPCEAPSALTLIRAVAPMPAYAWVWQGTALDEYRERGPLLVRLSAQEDLLMHAATHWMPIGGAIALEANVDLAALRDHLASLTQATAEGWGRLDISLHPDRLGGWIASLDDDHRESWLGPVTRAVWRMNLGPQHEWRHLERTASLARAAASQAMVLRPAELERLDAHAHTVYVSCLVNEVLALERHASRSDSEVRDWVERLLVQLDELYFRDEAVVGAFIRLMTQFPWLLDDERAAAIYNDLDESPQGRLRALDSLAQQQEADHA